MAHLRWMNKPTPASTRSKTPPTATPPITAMLVEPSVAVGRDQLMREPPPQILQTHPTAPKAPCKDLRSLGTNSTRGAFTFKFPKD